MKQKDIKGIKGKIIANQNNIKSRIKNKIRLVTIITVLIVLVLTFLLCQVSSFGQNENTEQNEATNSSNNSEKNYNKENYKEKDYNIEDDITDAYQKISESNTLELYCNMQDGNFIIKNKKDNSVWRSFVEEAEIQSDKKPNKKWIETMSSLVVLHYTNFSSKNTIPSADETVNINCKKVNDKLEIDMDFTKQKISLMLKIWIEEDVLHFEVPGSSIKEYGDIGIMQIDVLPFFMSACKGDKGYVFNPDGCGALYHFREENFHIQTDGIHLIFIQDLLTN